MDEEEEFEFALALKRKREATAPVTKEQTDTTPAPEKYDPYSFLNLTGAAVEPMMTLASGAAAMPVAGIAGLGAAGSNYLGFDMGDPAEVVTELQDRFTYQPRTGGGQIATEFITYPFQKLQEGAEWAGSKSAEQKDSPAYGAMTKAVAEVVPVLLGGKYAGKKLGGKKTVLPKQRQIVEDAILAIPNALGKIKDVSVNAVKNRLPGGAKNAARDVVIAMLEKHYPDVMKSLRTSKEGETAGQAAADAGSYEFLALQKAMESRHPSKYGEIHEAQKLGRQNQLTDNFGRTPEELAIAKKNLAKQSEAEYARTRHDRVDPRSDVQRLEAIKRVAEEKQVKAEEARNWAAKDAGRMDTLSQQQANIAKGNEPVGSPVAESLMKTVTGEKIRRGSSRFDDKGQPVEYSSPRYKGQPRAPERYAPQKPTADSAKVAANELKALHRDKITEADMYKGIQELIETNKLGESGTSMETFLGRPSVKRAIKKAKDAANEKGTYFPKNANEPFSVQNLQRIKRAIKEDMDAKAKSDKGLGPTETAEITSTLDLFTKWLRKKSKGFREAEDFYAREVKPVKQMETGQQLASELRGRESTSERPSKYYDAVEKMREKGGERNLTESQKQSIESVGEELYRDATMTERARLGNAAMNERMGTMYDLPKAGILERSIVIMNAILKRIEGKSTAKALDILSDEMMTSKGMAEFLKHATPEEAAVIKQAMKIKKQQAKVGGAIGAAQEAGE